MYMRKIVAIMAAVLMLCAAIPMGALSVAADGSFNFENGTVSGWQSGCDISVVDDNGNQVLKFDASGADWANVYYYGSSIVSANTDYTVSFRAKADRATNMNFKVNNNWAGDTAKQVVDVTTEWQEYSFVLNSGACTSGALLLFSSNTTAANGATYYLDDISFVEYVAPLEVGKIINGDFENGSEGWKLNASASVEDGTLKLENSGVWSEAAMQTVAVEVGTEYTLSWKSKRVEGSGAYMMFILKGDTSNHPAQGQNWMNETSGNWVEQTLVFTAEEDTLTIKVSCQDANAGVILIDDIKLAAKEYGKVINGDFETGDESGWTSNGAAIVDGGYNSEYAVSLNNPGQWSEALTQVIEVEPNTTYEITWMSKRISGSGAFNLIACQTVSPWGNFTKIAGQNWMNETSGNWVANSYTINSGDNTTMLLKLTTEAVNPGEILLDNIVMSKVIEATSDGFITNGNFETGKAAPEWTTYSGSAVSADAAYNGSYGLIVTNPAGNWNGTAYQDFTVVEGKTYEVTMWAKAISEGQNIQIQCGGNTKASKWFTDTAWTELTFTFTADATNARINICGGGTSKAEMIYIDDVKVVELKDPSFDGYVYNGDFELGEAPSKVDGTCIVTGTWYNLWGSNTVTLVEGYESDYAMSMVASSQWTQVRQDGIVVEANTTYRLSAVVKNAQNMAFVVKTGDDKTNLNSHTVGAFPVGEDWQLATLEFNTGVDQDGNAIDSISSICVLVISYEEAGGSVIIDNIKLEKVEEGCQHEYFYACDKVCMLCWEETRPEADHHIEHVAAKDAVSCIEPGNREYWYCTDCGAAWLDEDLMRFTNLRAVMFTAPCISDAEYPCQDGVCINCGMDYSADEEHTYDDEYDADCNVCGDTREVPERPVEIIYGDVNGDGEIDVMDEALISQFVNGWDVDMDEAAADVNGDGEVDVMDEALVSQFVNGWDVVLGPQA